MSAIDTVLSRVRKRKRVSKHEWVALCPAHKDGDPSLSIADRGDKVLLHCHGGCSQEAVVAALNLTMRDLFNENGSGSKPERKEIVATYPYTDEDGELLFEVVRYAPKDFRQRKPDGNGGWEWKLSDTRRVLFRLPEVIEAVALDKPIYLVEGEKDALALAEAGAVATCNAGGAGKWRDEYSESLRDARVIIIADKDKAGREHARKVAEALQGIAASVELLEAREGKDAADHLAAGHGVNDFIPMGDGDQEAEEEKSEVRTPRYRFLTDTDLENMKRPEELIEEVLPEEGLAALFGPPGAAKSLMCLDWALCLKTGTPWAGSRSVKPGHVVYVLAEAAATLGPRITAWKDYFNVHGTVGVSFLAEPVPLMDPVAVGDFIRDLRETVQEPPALIVFDTLARCMVGGDENSARDMGLFIVGADRIRKELQCAVLLVHHSNKSGESERGSTALRGAVDVLLFLKMADDGSLKLSCEKMKDSAPFGTIELKLKSHLDSVVLTGVTAMAVRSEDLAPSEQDTLRTLAVTAPSEGLAATRWLEVAEKKERTFWNHRKRLEDFGYVTALKTGNVVRYVVSAKGYEALGRDCHGSAI